jgi:thiol-disulfide isomerase/thioredoxin
MTSTTARIRQSLALAAALAVLLTGCAPEDINAPSGPLGYSTVGPVTEFQPSKRLAPVTFRGTLESGTTASSADWPNRVIVVNFWYAACGPCRAEAPDLEALYEEFKAQNVQFLGVDVRDEASTAQSFTSTYGITYPSFLDADGGAIQLAFAGQIAPNAVPTTVVLDRTGRVASRIVGRIQARSILRSLIETAISEKQ